MKSVFIFNNNKQFIRRMNVGLSDAAEYIFTPDSDVNTVDTNKIIKGYEVLSRLALGNFEPKDFTTVVCMVENSTNKFSIH
jgi:hypothetical protein